jgi:hypothetical protein
MIPVLPVIFAGALTMAAAADGVPTINVQPSCKAESDGIIGLKQDVEVCLKAEQNVRNELSQQWNGFPAADRASCVRLTTMSKAGTYTELLTCLEMKRDAAKLPKDTGTAGLGQTGTVGQGQPIR